MIALHFDCKHAETGDTWTDVWKFDRWGNLHAITSPLKIEQRLEANAGGREMAKQMLELYFKYITERVPGVEPRIVWEGEIHPAEVLFFLTMQEYARLLYPNYQPVQSDQPRSH